PALGGLFFRAGDPLNDGGLAPDLLRTCDLTNQRLLSAIRLLTEFRDKKGRVHRVDYQHLDAEELGSVYESLLELEPQIDGAEPRFWLENLRGNQRKTTGSYYTPTALIDELLKTTLDPIIEEYAKSGNPDDLLKITVCDPACGSGHFLVAAARRIAKKYAAMWSGDEEPTPATIREAMHKVVERCVYGVDLNPMAAELAKFSLWLESLEPGRPLAFLDSHIKVGNSLLGTTPKLLLQGIPDEAFKPIGDDDKKIAAQFRKENAKERGRQLAIQDEGLFDLVRTPEDTTELTRQATALNRMRIGTIADIREQARRFRTLLDSPELANRKRIADAWCAAFVYPKQTKPRPITSATLQIMGGDEEARKLFAQAAPTEEMERELEKIVEQYGFFHWHLEFPDVFRVGNDSVPDANHDTGWQGGFTCVLGNPPWDQVQVDAREFFAASHPEIAQASNMAARNKKLAELEEKNPVLYGEYADETRKNDGLKHFVHDSGRYPLTSYGRLNTYSLFAEAARTIVDGDGRVGQVVPTGIATDSFNQYFFNDLIQSRSLISLYEFENEEFVLSRDVHHSFRFCLLATSGKSKITEESVLAFGARKVPDLEGRKFVMPASDILLLNPNTGTCPVFRASRDARIVLNVYRRIPVLVREKGPKSNPWGVRFLLMFMMNSDSHRFKERGELERGGADLVSGNCFAHGTKNFVPLYEAKMIHQFDHRLGTYEGQSQAQANMGTLPRLSDVDKCDPVKVVLPRYWIEQKDVANRLEGRWDKEWLLGWRDIARATDERTAIFSTLPLSAVGHTLPLMMPALSPVAGLYANMNAFILDYILRQKMAGTHLTYGYVKQLPVLPPVHYEKSTPWESGTSLAQWIEKRVVELSYTAWVLESFAEELGDSKAPFKWDGVRRSAIRAELDAAYFHLYGVARDDVDYIMDSFGAFQRNDPERFARTKALILDVYDAMAQAMETGEPYRTILDPAPGEGPRHPDR
ncbi:Eco57I restriction-modification methylase domain-containing protein, partial [Actinomadura bangladeshensis]